MIFTLFQCQSWVSSSSAGVSQRGLCDFTTVPRSAPEIASCRRLEAWRRGGADQALAGLGTLITQLFMLFHAFLAFSFACAEE